MEMLQSTKIPDSVSDQINKVHKMCALCDNGHLSVDEVAKVLGRDKRSIITSMYYNHCPFGFISSDDRKVATIPVAKFYFWFMNDYLKAMGE